MRIRHVVPRSPADREESRLHVGEVITAVDGTPVAEVDNFTACWSIKWTRVCG
ncbi:hypothetical protein [Rhodothermus marinus]|uniref:hypothetical protein n=1 Tax=Rhodothermus marinus TaxID=29549 RepID=UPI001FB38AEE|nr:hypothetical protein [Rhodothermus marinus]